MLSTMFRTAYTKAIIIIARQLTGMKSTTGYPLTLLLKDLLLTEAKTKADSFHDYLIKCE